MNNFAEWLMATSPSVFIQIHEAWMLPVIQSMHITGIGIAVGSALMMTLRLLGWVGTDQTLLESQRRFGHWLTGALYLLLASGGLLILAEPIRELITFFSVLGDCCAKYRIRKEEHAQDALGDRAQSSAAFRAADRAEEGEGPRRHRRGEARSHEAPRPCRA